MSDLHPCPCCGYPTLLERGAYEICTICWWEDDGQDDDNADAVRGGPNGAYSLTQARANFADHFDMYDKGNGIGIVANPSPSRVTLLSYLKSIREGAVYDERKLHGLLRSLTFEDRKPLP